MSRECPQFDPLFPGAECWSKKLTVPEARRALESWLKDHAAGRLNSIRFAFGWFHAICFIPLDGRSTWGAKRINVSRG
jgi:hypothetical protein